MGQYYNVVMGDENGKITGVFDRYIMIGGQKEYTMAKLMEHAYLSNPFTNAISRKLMDKPQRVAWVGDYAYSLTNGGKSYGENYYEDIRNSVGEDIAIPTFEDVYGENGEGVNYDVVEYSPTIDWENMYLVNYSTEQYIDMAEYIKNSENDWGEISPLALLTAVGNGGGGGDYHGRDDDIVGSWAWHLIGIVDRENDMSNFEKIEVNFKYA